MTLSIPEAPATLKPVRDGRRVVNLWVIERCPYCGRRHTHRAGVAGVNDPRQALGHRVAHCVTKDGRLPDNPGYVLIEHLTPADRPAEARR